jgi:hypothetical protein
MSKFLDFLERIREGAPAPMGFGAARAEKLPGMALVGLISGDHSNGVGVVSEIKPDAALIAGVDSPEGLKKLTESLPSLPWGASVSSLTQEEAQAYQDNGADLLTFTLEGTSASALSGDEITRVLCLDPSIEQEELRTIASLPVDAFLLSMTSVSGSWTLKDLATVGAISRRVDKYILLEVSQPPGEKDLEALRDIGVSGLVVDVGAVASSSLSQLKTALLEMPRPRPPRRGRSRAILPGSVFDTSPAAAPAPRREEEEEEDDE